jgi:endonuclease/exonuclease/phosphatase family metal-dependent hydrolase
MNPTGIRTIMKATRTLLLSGLVAGLALTLTSCRSAAAPETPEPPFTLAAGPAGLPAVEAVGTDTTLDVGTWNLEWFGDPGNGPEDEGRQLENVWALLDGLDVDVWSVQEVAREDHFRDLVAQLVGYEGILATDPVVVGGVDSYSDFGGNELKVGLLYRAGAVEVRGARVILSSEDHAFAGRPPVELRLGVGTGADVTELVIILLHAKAGAGADDRARRETAATALRQHLDTEWPGTRVLVIGDFNDDVDASITSGQDTPYRAFVDDPDYAFTTAPLSAAGRTSTVYYSDMIDHHLATDELAAELEAGSARVVPAGDYLAGYGDTTSDHYPVVVRYAVPGSATVGSQDHGHIALSWVGSGALRVDIFRDDARIATTANDGTYTDTVMGPGPFTYRVCAAGTGVCTDPVSIRP